MLRRQITSVVKRFCASSAQTHMELEAKPPHIPVMLQEVLTYLKPESNQLILDMTFGAGGHSRSILEKSQDLKVISLDRDPTAHEYAQQLSAEYPGRVIPILGRFSELPSLLSAQKIYQNSIDAMLFDFGCSSMQFDTAERGFSLSQDGPLDMRMDKDRFPEEPTAGDVLRLATEEDLAKIIKVYGEEKQAKKIARAIVETRYMFNELRTTKQLAELVESVCNAEFRLDKIDRPASTATKTFQAIRIFVNNELNEINYGLLLAKHYLKLGGRLVTITFHSLEDTIVKRHLSGNLVANSANPLPLKFSSHLATANKAFMADVMESSWQSLCKHVVVPSDEEVELNPRCRSAKLRAAVRVK